MSGNKRYDGDLRVGLTIMQTWSLSLEQHLETRMNLLGRTGNPTKSAEDRQTQVMPATTWRRTERQKDSIHSCCNGSGLLDKSWKRFLSLSAFGPGTHIRSFSNLVTTYWYHDLKNRSRDSAGAGLLRVVFEFFLSCTSGKISHERS